MRSRLARNISAHLRDSTRVSTAPYLLSVGAEHQRLDPCGGQRLDDLFAPFFGQMVGKESAVPDDNSHSHWSCHDNNLARSGSPHWSGRAESVRM